MSKASTRNALNRAGAGHKALADCLRGLARKHSLWKVWQDFCFFSAAAISNAVDPGQATEREAEYMRRVKDYDREEMLGFSRALALLVEELDAGLSDVLGSLFMVLELGDAWKGQFFTPWEICKLKAAMLCGSAEDLRAEIARKPGGFLRVSDPCVGGGAMLLAFAAHVRELGINDQLTVHYTAQDLDLTAVHMAYVQMSLAGMPGVVIHGNTLTNEVRSVWRTPFHVTGRWAWRMAQADQAGRTDAAAREGLALCEVPEMPAARSMPVSSAPLAHGQAVDESSDGADNAGPAQSQAPEASTLPGQLTLF